MKLLNVTVLLTWRKVARTDHMILLEIARMIERSNTCNRLDHCAEKEGVSMANKFTQSVHCLTE